MHLTSVTHLLPGDDDEYDDDDAYDDDYDEDNDDADEDACDYYVGE